MSIFVEGWVYGSRIVDVVLTACAVAAVDASLFLQAWSFVVYVTSVKVTQEQKDRCQKKGCM